MAHLSVRLPDSVIADLNAMAEAEGRNKAVLVREALELYRLHQISLAKKERLSRASRLVRADSMRVNAEFTAFEGEPHET